MEKENTFIDAENDFALTARSSVKLIKNSKGINWEIKVVKGEENLVGALKDKALEVHKEFESKFTVDKK